MLQPPGENSSTYLVNECAKANRPKVHRGGGRLGLRKEHDESLLPTSRHRGCGKEVLNRANSFVLDDAPISPVKGSIKAINPRCLSPRRDRIASQTSSSPIGRVRWILSSSETMGPGSRSNGLHSGPAVPHSPLKRV